LKGLKKFYKTHREKERKKKKRKPYRENFTEKKKSSRTLKSKDSPILQLEEKT